MDPFGNTVVATLAISLTAWVGVLTLFFSDRVVDDALLVLVSLSAGALVGGAFFHLLPSALAATPADATLGLFLTLVGGFSAFFVLEQFIQWHHHHVGSHEGEPVTYLVLVADAVHNFIDGLVVAGAFLVDVPTGVVTSLAIALHEVPQEVGDFGVLVYGGFSRLRALVLNYLTQATVILGGVVGVLVGQRLAGVPTLLLAFAAGGFVYIASSDLIPEIKRETDAGRSLLYFGVYLAGLVLMLGVRELRGLLG